MTSDTEKALRRAADLAQVYLKEVAERPVGVPIDLAALRQSLGGPLPETGEDPAAVVEALARGADPGLVATAGPRYFGFVVGGAHPAALGADWLAAAWDQTAGPYVGAPAAAVVEEIAAGWLRELFGLPENASAGFTTGATMANFTALAAARHAVLSRAGWDVESKGLFGAPPIEVIVGEETHATIFAALQMLGLGRDRVTRVAVDGQGRMRPDQLSTALGAGGGPTIVCAQAGNVNSGAFDPLRAIAETCRGKKAWMHVDGAFGLWAAVVPRLRAGIDGIECADSWSVDAHKWLNVPYDSGLVFVADATAHGAAMTITADYLVPAEHGGRDPWNWVPEFSRRARGFAVYAALRSMGRQGLSDMIDRCCRLARRMADALSAEPGIEILNEVALNQVLVRFTPRGAPVDKSEGDGFTRAVIARVQDEGTCWLGPTVWRDLAAMRISVSNWSTTEADADRSVKAIIESFGGARATLAPESAK